LVEQPIFRNEIRENLSYLADSRLRTEGTFLRSDGWHVRLIDVVGFFLDELAPIVQSEKGTGSVLIDESELRALAALVESVSRATAGSTMRDESHLVGEFEWDQLLLACRSALDQMDASERRG
jgi:hypothetical protein